MAFEDGYQLPADAESRRCFRYPRLGHVLFTVFVATTSAVIAAVTTVNVMLKHADKRGVLTRRADARGLSQYIDTDEEQKAGIAQGPVVMKYTGCSNWPDILISSTNIDSADVEKLVLKCSELCSMEDECESYNIAIPTSTTIISEQKFYTPDIILHYNM
ncbi:unnamed protein product [Prorocentrum cordatum]|uniref:Apple domain-containing protein n=1 Tax=Prorocentrum cordatum TaxID=2364126 RepID=A0ABN9TXG8_9DINO|nr:unnamed protein product [Polarella glacialis]